MDRKHSLIVFVIALAAALLVAVSTALAHGAANDRAAEPAAPLASADLSLTAQASSDLVQVGQPLTFTFEIANHGPATAADVTLVHRFYADVAFTAWAADGVCSYRQREFSCSLGALSVNQTTIVTLTVKPRQAGQLFSHVVLSADEDDPTPLDNLAWFESAVSGKTGTAFLVKDINPQTYSDTLDVSDPQQLTPVGDLLFFVRQVTETHELWVTDNSMRGADRLITYTRYSSENVIELQGLTKAANTLFFLTENSDGITCLWRSDGTSRGTQSVLGDACATADAEILATVDNWLFFTYIEWGSSGLWHRLGKIDGAHSNSAPVPVKPIMPHVSNSKIESAVNVNGTLFFFVSTYVTDGYYGQVWKSDGTEAGTVMVKDLGGPGFDGITAYAEFNRYAFFAFSTNGGTAGGDLWRSDGTEAGTVIVKDPNPNGYALVEDMFSAGGSLYFQANHVWWKSDGTSTGTAAVSPYEPTPCANALGMVCDYHGANYVAGDDIDHGTELWKWGSAISSTLVKDINPGAADSSPDELTIFADLLVFSADDGAHGRQLWISDGTGPGTRLLFSFVWPKSSDPRRLTDVNGTLFFDADDGIHGPGLWKSDGTSAGTALVKAMSGLPRWLVNFHETLFFVSGYGTGDALWKSDGTEAGTVAVKDWSNGQIVYPTVVSDTLFFVVSAAGRIELWRSDGTPDGTELVREFPYQYDNYNLADLTAVGSTLFFSADDNDVQGRELWKSDGTYSGTVMVQDLTPSPYASSAPRDLVSYKGALYFVGYDSAQSSRVLLKSDGTPDGTLLVRPFAAEEGAPQGLYVVGSTLFFLTYNGDQRYLWTSGGSVGNTSLIRDLGAAPYWSGYTFAQVDGLLYLNLNGHLWTSTGTPSGTRAVVEDLGMDYPVSADGLLYFMSGGSGSSPFGQELWKSDGTPEGTLLLQDINPGRASASPAYLTRSGISDTVLLFNADDGRHRKELWGKSVAACTWAGLYGDNPLDPRNWTSCNGGAPYQYDNANINIPPHRECNYVVATHSQANDVTVCSSGSMDVSPGGMMRATQAGAGALCTTGVLGTTGAFTITGDLHNNGAFTATAGAVVFAGQHQVIGGSGSTTFNDLVISAGTSVVIQAANPPTVTGILSNYGTLVQTRDVTASATTRFSNLTDASGAGKYWGVEITPSSGAMGATQARVSGHQACVAFDGVQETSPSQSVLRCYEILPTTPKTATLRFYYSLDEANGNSSPAAYGWNGTAWQRLTSTNGGSGEVLYVEASNVSGYSLFMLKDAPAERKVYLPLVIR